MNTKPRFTYLENGAFALATLVIGVMTGFFWAYTFNVNLAMSEVDGSTYAAVQSLLNQNVRHFTFFIFFFGGSIFSVGALIFNIRHYRHVSFLLMIAASIVYTLGIILFTRQVNLPLNALTESWDPANLPENWQEVRDGWNLANAFRMVMSLGSFLLCLLALVVRASDRDQSAQRM